MRILFLLIFSCNCAVLAQEMTAQEAQANLNVIGGAGYTARTFDNRYEGVKGCPTFFEKYTIAVIRQTDGRRGISKETNLDLMNQELIFKKKNQEWVLSRGFVRNFTFFDGKDSIRFLKEVIGDKGEQYLQCLTQGQLMLLKLNVKTFVRANYEGAYSADRTYDEFKNGKKTFLKLSNGNIVEIKNKKDIIKALPGKETLISNYVKGNLLDLKNESHLISLIEYLDTSNTTSK
jgi:hypothetical protein